jgi:hypothetical protein
MTSDTSAVAALPPIVAEHNNAVNAFDTNLIVNTCSALALHHRAATHGPRRLRPAGHCWARARSPVTDALGEQVPSTEER